MWFTVIYVAENRGCGCVGQVGHRRARASIHFIFAIENRFIEQYNHRFLTMLFGLLQCPHGRDQKPLRFARMTAELHKAKE